MVTQECQNSTGEHSKVDTPKNPKRINNFWEPLYDPDFSGLNANFDWNVHQKSVFTKLACTSDRLLDSIRTTEIPSWKGNNLSFIECDFSGDFNTILSFKKCRFFKCDMGSSIWRKAKFSECQFDSCSFTVATFEYCIFNNCTWLNSGISGTETKIFDTVITNPKPFIESAYTNTDEALLKRKNLTTPAYQIFRLEESKLKLARLVLSNNERHADDKAYYESVKVYLLQSISAKVSKAKYHRSKNERKVRNFISEVFGWFERKIITFSGSINGWGGNISRAAVFGAIVILFFTIAYRFIDFGCNLPLDWKLSFIKSFDISLLIGYTKHATTALGWQEQAIYGSNALLGLWWYAIFVPTVINRICRVR